MPAHSSSPERVFLDVLEEHRDGAEYGLELFEAALLSPMRTLDQLQRHPEHRLLAHLDGLALASPTSRAALLEASLDAPDPQRSTATSVAAYSLVPVAPEKIIAALLEPNARAAALRGAQLSRDRSFAQRLLGHQEPALRDAGLTLCATLGMQPPPCFDVLQSEEPQRIRGALVAVRHGDPRSYRAIVEWLLWHEDAKVRDAALTLGLAWALPLAWTALEKAALERPSESALMMYASFGGRREHKLLLDLLGRPELRQIALVALGATGNPAVLPGLYPWLSGGSPREAKLALEAASSLVGLDLGDAALHLPKQRGTQPDLLPEVDEDPEALAALPPLDADDLDADLVPGPEFELPDVDVNVAIERCERFRGTAHDGRHLAGLPYSRERLAAYLPLAPMRQRGWLALGASVRARGAAWLDEGAFTRVQRSQTSALCQSLPERFVDPRPW